MSEMNCCTQRAWFFTNRPENQTGNEDNFTSHLMFMIHMCNTEKTAPTNEQINDI